MRLVFTITLLLAFGVASAQRDETAKDTTVYKYEPRYYNVVPCGCAPPKKDSATVKKDTLKPIVVSAFARKEEWG